MPLMSKQGSLMPLMSIQDVGRSVVVKKTSRVVDRHPRQSRDAGARSGLSSPFCVSFLGFVELLPFEVFETTRVPPGALSPRVIHTIRRARRRRLGTVLGAILPGSALTAPRAPRTTVAPRPTTRPGWRPGIRSLRARRAAGLLLGILARSVDRGSTWAVPVCRRR